MIKNLEPEIIQDLYHHKKVRDHENRPYSSLENEETEYRYQWMIIRPQNWYNVVKNDVVLSLFIIYSILLPYVCCQSLKVPTVDIDLLMIFDYIFLTDRFTDILVGYINEENKLEPSITKVIFKNLSFAVFIELGITVIPLMFHDVFISGEWNALLFFAIKAPRFLRLFEMEDQIYEIMDYNS
jgi:hypothetical protein